MSSRSWQLAAALVLMAGTARAGIVERVVAVVGDKAILKSDLDERAKPALLRVHASMPAGAKRRAAVKEARKLVLERLIDEQLMQKAARKASIVVKSDEVDRAIENIAAQNKVTVEKLYTELRKAGVTERQYRSEMRRQLLEMRMTNLRTQGRVRVTEDDMKATYRQVVQKERKTLPYRIAWITLALPRNGEERAAVFKKAEGIAQRASRGADFGTLARKHSTDAKSRNRGGLLPAVRPGQLPKAVDLVTFGLSRGETSAPFRVGNRVVIVKLIERQPSRLPSYAQARGKLAQRLQMQKQMETMQRWLAGMRRRTHVDVRLPE